MKIEAVMGASAVMTGLLSFGPALLFTEGMSAEQIVGLQIGFLVTVIGGSTLLWLSCFETDEDPAYAV